MRSFVSIPAGVLRFPFWPYTLLDVRRLAIWALAFAGAGWALGDKWEQVHHAFRYADYVAVVAIAVVAASRCARS